MIPYHPLHHALDSEGSADAQAKTDRLPEPLWLMTAHRDCTVLITGETGTGKEYTAERIHRHSPRSDGPFIAVDCAGLRDTLMESQLFGHVRGAFTDAYTDTLGFFRVAHGGTLFLDEIGELDLTVQCKLLRVLQDHAVVPLGATRPIPVDVRFIAATNRDMEAMVRENQFRQDLFYRLDVVRINLLPLRRRREQIIPLALHFLQHIAKLYEEPVKTLRDDAIDALLGYHWPGNIRELANVMEHACVLAQRETIIRPHHLPDHLTNLPSDTNQFDDLPIRLEDAQQMLIHRALRVTGGHRGRAAKMLGIHRQRLYNMLKRFEKTKTI